MELGLPWSAEIIEYQSIWQQKGCSKKWCLYLKFAVLKVKLSVMKKRQWTVVSKYKDLSSKNCLPVSVNRCKMMHKWHDWCICSVSFIYCCLTSVWMEEFLMGIFKCKFLPLQLSYAEFTHISSFGLLFSTEKSDSRATHLTAVFFFPAQKQIIFCY